MLGMGISGKKNTLSHIFKVKQRNLSHVLQIYSFQQFLHRDERAAKIVCFDGLQVTNAHDDHESYGTDRAWRPGKKKHKIHLVLEMENF